MKSDKTLHIIAYILLLIGGLSWMTHGLFYWDLGSIFGDSIVTRGLYVLIGLAAIYEIITHKQACKHCEESALGAVSSPASDAATKPDTTNDSETE